jgi:hypothetical protein
MDEIADRDRFDPSSRMRSVTTSRQLIQRLSAAMPQPWFSIIGTAQPSAASASSLRASRWLFVSAMNQQYISAVRVAAYWLGSLGVVIVRLLQIAAVNIAEIASNLLTSR